jgi:hypothetical protein
MKYRVFATEQAARAAEQAISEELGYPKPGVNAATGEIVPTALTLRWAEVQQIQDGRWVFVSPDDQGEEAAADWWPTAEGYLE